MRAAAHLDDRDTARSRAGVLAGGRVADLDLLMVAVVCLCCLGLVMAVSIGGPRPGVGPLLAMKAQGAKLAAGLVAFLVCAAVPLRLLRGLALPAFVLGVGLCYAAALLFPPVNGAGRWIRGPFGGFQPVELARFGLILTLARVLADAGPDVVGLRRGFVPAMGAGGVLAVGLVLQPDLGNAALALALAGVVALVAGVRVRWFATFGVLGAAAFGAAMWSKGHAYQRLVGFFGGEQSAQVTQSLTAIASGGVFGQGLGNGWMKMGFVPEARNDFVFAVVGEELGLLGTLAVVGCYAGIGLVGYRLVMRMRDPFARLLVFGLTFAICLQAAINLLVVTGLVPPKGIDLPFVSSGGTNLVFCLSAVGAIGNAARTDGMAQELEID